MPLAHRGLLTAGLTAGLTAVVVASMGVASTLRADAQEIPAALAATPPPPLPARDGRVESGKPGPLSSAASASAATLPTAVHAPKGTGSPAHDVKGRWTDVSPAGPAAAAVYFYYAKGTQVAASDGTYGDIAIARPELTTTDYHTLAELSVESADSKQIVEVGWHVDRSVHDDDDPHLFVYHWVDGQQTCYNGCGWEQYSTAVKPGDALPVGVSKRFGIQHSGGNWWVWYDTAWIGYFPDSLWKGTYTRAGVQQYFGEVASPSTAPCSDMGNGRPAADPAATRIDDITLLNGPAAKFDISSTSDYYSTLPEAANAFRFGGAGAC
jgi:hypothetical protein